MFWTLTHDREKKGLRRCLKERKELRRCLKERKELRRCLIERKELRRCLIERKELRRCLIERKELRRCWKGQKVEGRKSLVGLWNRRAANNYSQEVLACYELLLPAQVVG
jgi:hypothetical protein